jgi:hypothetical protein
VTVGQPEPEARRPGAGPGAGLRQSVGPGGPRAAGAAPGGPPSGWSRRDGWDSNDTILQASGRTLRTGVLSDLNSIRELVNSSQFESRPAGGPGPLELIKKIQVKIMKARN